MFSKSRACHIRKGDDSDAPTEDCQYYPLTHALNAEPTLTTHHELFFPKDFSIELGKRSPVSKVEFECF